MNRSRQEYQEEEIRIISSTPLYSNVIYQTTTKAQHIRFYRTVRHHRIYYFHNRPQFSSQHASLFSISSDCAILGWFPALLGYRETRTAKPQRIKQNRS